MVWDATSLAVDLKMTMMHRTLFLYARLTQTRHYSHVSQKTAEDRLEDLKHTTSSIKSLSMYYAVRLLERKGSCSAFFRSFHQTSVALLTTHFISIPLVHQKNIQASSVK